MAESDKSLIVFQDKKIRRIWKEDKWHFSIIDVVAVLTDSTVPKRYWADLKSKLNNEGFEAYVKIVPLKLMAEDGKLRFTDCADTETIFRIIQSIPSPKAEPFKMWLARVGYERIQEIENPELGQIFRIALRKVISVVRYLLDNSRAIKHPSFLHLAYASCCVRNLGIHFHLDKVNIAFNQAAFNNISD